MENTQLLFVPFPVIGHLIAMVELTKLLLSRDHRLSVTVLIMKLSIFDSNVIKNYIQSFAPSTSLSNRIRFIDLPEDKFDEPFIFASFIERQKLHVKQVVSEINQPGSDSPRLAGFVHDMFCTGMIDVANDFGVPSYIFFTSSAAFLGFMLHMLVIYDEQNVDPTELKESDTELAVPSLVHPFPAKFMPSALLQKEWLHPLLDNFRRFKEAEGIIVNTFFELESYAIESFNNGKTKKTSSLFPVGPILNLECDTSSKQQEIIQWLDDQPASSVVFLCFGSMGSFGEDQVKEIAYALEHSGHHFLWSLRRPPPTGKIESPSDYENPQEVLPEGFLDRTAKIGKIVGWAPQVAILAHQAIGGFVSHCGWNSTLESIWYGVPIATWPMYAEQQFNAFEMVIELELAVEIKMDYRKDSQIIVNCDEIERGIRCVMEQDSEKRKKVKEMSERSRMALMEGGSSCIWLDCLIKDVISNMS
ncbi:anthocyanidin 3-O-glucosyltransferase 2 [Jatropha curcas]|uniref:anthocyanidin 3-O-glucosyltransferase 2 n=1 Tax=Jatropha curcas TaxID=180498 RepID=UPI001893999D|nr:anthocyanidin 3-O-glucosyltransferase 2 [Jatropha curcas]